MPSHQNCTKSPTGKHVANPFSGSFPAEAVKDEFLHFVVDFDCKYCGRSGSVRVNTEEISWD